MFVWYNPAGSQWHDIGYRKTLTKAGLESILELELLSIPIPGIEIQKELEKRNWN